MNRLLKIHELTNQISELLNRTVDSSNRESIISEVTNLIDKRGEHMELLNPPYKEEEFKMGKSLIAINQDIEEKMQNVFHDLKIEMKQVQQQKKTTNQYKNPYKAVDTMDGMFMDSKN